MYFIRGLFNSIDGWMSGFLEGYLDWVPTHSTLASPIWPWEAGLRPEQGLSRPITLMCVVYIVHLRGLAIMSWLNHSSPLVARSYSYFLLCLLISPSVGLIYSRTSSSRKCRLAGRPLPPCIITLIWSIWFSRKGALCDEAIASKASQQFNDYSLLSRSIFQSFITRA